MAWEPPGARRSYARASRAVACAFFVTGFVFGTWAARVPAVQAGLGLCDRDLALALAVLNGGAMLGLQAGAALVPRFGARATLCLSLPAFALLLPAIGAAPNLAVLIAALAASAGVNGVVDVAINAGGVAVERRYDRAILSRLHAMHALGGITGAALAAAAAWLSPGVFWHFTLVALGAAAVAVLSARHLLHDRPPAADRAPDAVAGEHGPVATAAPERRSAVPDRTGVASARWVAGVGAVAFCVTLTEGGANDWAAVYLRHAGAGGVLAAGGVAVFLSGMTLGRLAGDRLRARFTAVPLFRAAALVAAAGLGAALLIGRPVAGLAGFALLGTGLSVTLPLALGAAGHRAADAGVSPSGAVARVSTIAYLGAFVGPALIGTLASATGLRTALLLPALTVAAAAAAAPTLAVRPARSR